MVPGMTCGAQIFLEKTAPGQRVCVERRIWTWMDTEEESEDYQA